MWPLEMDSQRINHDDTLVLLLLFFVFLSAPGKNVLPLLSSFPFAIVLHILFALEARGAHLC